GVREVVQREVQEIGGVHWWRGAPQRRDRANSAFHTIPCLQRTVTLRYMRRCARETFSTVWRPDRVGDIVLKGNRLVSRARCSTLRRKTLVNLGAGAAAHTRDRTGSAFRTISAAHRCPSLHAALRTGNRSLRGNDNGGRLRGNDSRYPAFLSMPASSVVRPSRRMRSTSLGRSTSQNGPDSRQLK